MDFAKNEKPDLVKDSNGAHLKEEPEYYMFLSINIKYEEKHDACPSKEK